MKPNSLNFIFSVKCYLSTIFCDPALLKKFIVKCFDKMMSDFFWYNLLTVHSWISILRDVSTIWFWMSVKVKNLIIIKILWTETVDHNAFMQILSVRFSKIDHYVVILLWCFTLLVRQSYFDLWIKSYTFSLFAFLEKAIQGKDANHGKKNAYKGWQTNDKIVSVDESIFLSWTVDVISIPNDFWWTGRV